MDHGYFFNFNKMASGASITHLHYHMIPRYPDELGVADLIAGKRVLVEDPSVTRDRIKESLAENATLSRLQQRRNH